MCNSRFSLLFRASNAQGHHILRSQVHRCPGFLELILFLHGPANLCLERSVGRSELPCDLIFSVNEVCYEWKSFSTAQKLSHSPINPTDSSMGLYLLLRLKGLLHQSLGREGRGWLAGGGDCLMFPNIVLSLSLILSTTLMNPFSSLWD